MHQMGGAARGPNRSAPHHANESSQRRAPYAQRACNACKKRKGRCSGLKPCAYCTERSIDCVFANTAGDAWRQPAATTNPSRALTNLLNPSEDFQWNSESLNHLSQLVANLQGQIGTLATQISESRDGASSRRPSNLLSPQPTDEIGSNVSVGTPPAVSAERSHSDPRPTSAKRRQRFYGPTSPDYSLNMAQMRMRKAQAQERSGDHGLASIDDDINNTDEEAGNSDDDCGEERRTSQIRHSLQDLLHFRDLISKNEALRLLSVYQEIHGDFHPILDLERLAEQMMAFYDWTITQNRGNRSDDLLDQENNLLIVNLAVAIALCTESTSKVHIAKVIYAKCRPVINSKLSSPATSVKNVIVALLVAVYHFFRYNPRFSWRTVALAGHMLMELGLHSRDVPQHILRSDHERNQVIAITCSAYVLDRQFSAATGLPTTFQQSLFQPALKSGIDSPYLKAMVSFIVLSDKFTSPISSIAATGQIYEEDDAFEVVNFQIEQWRKASVGKFNLSQYGSWRSTPLARIPSWAILLNLRAHAAHGMLLRPFFFAKTPTAASRRNVQPALHVLSDTINILSSLDETTDIYRKQHPNYQHLLSSSCALMFLLVAHVEQHSATLDLPEDFADVIAQSYKKALHLAMAYKTYARASRRLWRRLLLLEEPLLNLGILRRSHSQERPEAIPATMPESSNRTVTFNTQPPAGHGASTFDHAPSDHIFRGFTGNNLGLTGANPAVEEEGGGMDESWATALLYDWPMAEASTFFSEGGF